MKVKMMKWWLCLCSFMAVGAVSSQAVYDVNRSMTRSYPWTESTRIEIENKYGDVILEVWEEDSVKIDVEVAIQSKKWDTAQELSDMAIVTMESQGSFIVARTDWGGDASFWGHAKHEVRSVFGKDHKVEITYKVYTPDKTAIEIRNKFGDIFIPSFEGEVIADVAHGDLRSPYIANPHRVSVEYGHAKVDEWGNGNLNLFFAEMRSQKAGELRITSKSSKIYLDGSERLTLDSRNDEFFLGQVKTVRGSCHFSSADIKSLTSDMDLKQDYGDLTVSHVDSTFSAITVHAKRSKILIQANQALAFDYSIKLVNGERFASVPELISIKKDEEGDDQRLIEGYWYSAGSGRMIRIDGEKSVIEIARD